MSRTQALEVFRGYRFALIEPASRTVHGAVSVRSESHAVLGEIVRVSVGHVVGRRPLAAHLIEHRAVELWAVVRDTARRFTIHHDRAVWHPLNFDAMSNETAHEDILLVNPRVTIVDVAFDQCPVEVQRMMRPPAEPKDSPKVAITTEVPALRHVCGLYCDDPCEHFGQRRAAERDLRRNGGA